MTVFCLYYAIKQNTSPTILFSGLLSNKTANEKQETLFQIYWDTQRLSYYVLCDQNSLSLLCDLLCANILHYYSTLCHITEKKITKGSIP